MLDDLSQIQSRIQEIQDRISTLVPPPPAAPTPQAAVPGGAAPLPSFSTALLQAQDPPPAGVRVPPASLGPLPPLPVSPTTPGVTPLPIQTSDLGDYEGIIQDYAAKHGLAPALVKAIIRTESGGNPKAVSRAGAMGLMQLMPSDVQEAGIADPFDPTQNIAAGTQQLSDLLQQFHGNLDLALAGYNAGPGNVRKYGGVPPFAETQSYIRKVRAAMANE